MSSPLNPPVLSEDLVEQVAALVAQASAAIVEHYAASDLQVRIKEDDSPVTAADEAAHRIIVPALEALTPDIPVVSEESAQRHSLAERATWSHFWLVDPLDGTKEYIDRNGEFTVNVALVAHGLPVLGLLSVPVQDCLYIGDVRRGLAQRWRYGQEGASTRTRSSARGGEGFTAGGQVERSVISVSHAAQPLRVVASRRHRSAAQQTLMAALQDANGTLKELSVGSALKLARVAEGAADLYPRIGPTSQWDIAAGHALLLAAGGWLEALDGTQFSYEQSESYLNGDFVAGGDPGLRALPVWRDLDGLSQPGQEF